MRDGETPDIRQHTSRIRRRDRSKKEDVRRQGDGIVDSSSHQAQTAEPHASTIVLSLPAGLLCATLECPRITSYAIADRQESRQWILTPGCWEHGYVEASVYGKSEEQESIKRFILGHFDALDQGQVSCIDSCPTSEVPEYRPWDPLEVYSSVEEYQDLHREDKAWRVIYRDGKRQEQTLYVIWSYDVSCFDLYPVDQSEEEETS